MDYEGGRYNLSQRKSEGRFQKNWEWMSGRRKCQFSIVSRVVEGLNEIVHVIYLAQNYPNNSNRINAGPSCLFLLTLRVQACALWPPKLSRRISSNCRLPHCSCRLPGNPHGMRGSVVMSSFYLGEPRGDLSPLVPGFWPDCRTLPTCLCDS